MPMDLFTRGPLQQTSGELAERWGQDGSNITNISGSTGATGDTIYTVTAGKKFYCSAITFYATAATTLVLRDPGPGTPNKYTQAIAAANTGYTVQFNTPLVFESAIYLFTSNCTIFLTGWEE